MIIKNDVEVNTYNICGALKRIPMDPLKWTWRQLPMTILIRQEVNTH